MFPFPQRVSITEAAAWKAFKEGAEAQGSCAVLCRFTAASAGGGIHTPHHQHKHPPSPGLCCINSHESCSLSNYHPPKELAMQGLFHCSKG